MAAGGQELSGAAELERSTAMASRYGRRVHFTDKLRPTYLALANFNISLARRSSLFSRPSSLTR